MQDARGKSRSIQFERILLNDLMNELGTVDEFLANALLRSALLALKRSLNRERCLILIQHLPPYLKDLYSEGWKPVLVAGEPKGGDILREIHERLATDLPRRKNSRDLLSSTFKFLSSFLSVPDSRKIREGLPETLRELWPAW